jgi:hypothetical protein
MKLIIYSSGCCGVLMGWLQLGRAVLEPSAQCAGACTLQSTS